MIDYGKIYDNASEFFDLDGNCIMYLTKLAAIDVCESAAKKELCIYMIEGGYWKEPGFQSNLGAIWSCEEQVIDIEDTNQKAIIFINNINESEGVDTFILTFVEE